VKPRARRSRWTRARAGLCGLRVVDVVRLRRSRNLYVFQCGSVMRRTASMSAFRCSACRPSPSASPAAAWSGGRA